MSSKVQENYLLIITLRKKLVFY